MHGEVRISITEAAQLKGVHPATIRRWILAGRLRSEIDATDRRRRLVQLKEIDEVIEQNVEHSKEVGEMVAMSIPAPKIKNAERLAYRQSELARMLGVSVPHVAAMIERGELKAIKSGRAVLIPVSEVKRLLEAA